MTVVTIDSNYEEVTAACQEYRQNELYPILALAGATLESFAGKRSTRARIKKALTGGVDFVSGSGHGVETRFTGTDGDPLLEIGSYDPAEVNGTIVHLLACLTAAALGADLVRNGCRAFFGYDVVFAFPLDMPEGFLACDAVIDRALVDGKNAGAAYAEAFDAFTALMDEMLAQGQPYLAAMLEYNRDHLCAPSVDPKWGSVAAKLGT
jgi:hypothetical protein